MVPDPSAPQADYEAERAAAQRGPKRKTAQDYVSEDIALLADMVSLLATENQGLHAAISRRHWWQFWRPKLSPLLQDQYQTIWSLTRDIRNGRDPDFRLQAIWDRGTRWYL